MSLRALLNSDQGRPANFILFLHMIQNKYLQVSSHSGAKIDKGAKGIKEIKENETKIQRYKETEK